MTTYHLTSTPWIKNRRIDQRLEASRTSISEVKMATGEVVDLINISHSGALLEGDSRMRPGMRVTLRVKETQEPDLVCGRVIRCSIVGLCEGALRYRFAVAFDKPIDFQILPGEAASDRSGRERATPLPELPSPVKSTTREPHALNNW